MPRQNPGRAQNGQPLQEAHMRGLLRTLYSTPGRGTDDLCMRHVYGAVAHSTPRDAKQATSMCGMYVGGVHAVLHPRDAERAVLCQARVPRLLRMAYPSPVGAERVSSEGAHPLRILRLQAPISRGFAAAQRTRAEEARCIRTDRPPSGRRRTRVTRLSGHVCQRRKSPHRKEPDAGHLTERTRMPKAEKSTSKGDGCGSPD